MWVHQTRRDEERTPGNDRREEARGAGVMNQQDIYDLELKHAYKMGADYAKNGATSENCNFMLFRTDALTAEWERGVRVSAVDPKSKPQQGQPRKRFLLTNSNSLLKSGVAPPNSSLPPTKIVTTLSSEGLWIRERSGGRAGGTKR